jgi:hypothetical protein
MKLSNTLWRTPAAYLLRGSIYEGTSITKNVGIDNERPATTRQAVGGCNFLENPEVDSRSANPVWIASSPSVAALATAGISAGVPTFSIWLARRSRTLLHDGRWIHLRVGPGYCPTELTFPPELAEGSPFSFQITPGRFQRLSWLAARQANEILTATSANSISAATFPARRTATAHMRMLQALDGRAAGASHRQIAAAIFGNQMVLCSWSADGELRAQVRYLLRKSAQLAFIGYRQLAGLEESLTGDSSVSRDSP